MKKLTLIFTYVLIFSQAASARSKEDGGLPGDFLSLAANARTLSMGRAGAADPGSGIFFNPASLAYLQRKELSFMYTQPFPESKYGLISYCHPFKCWGFGLGLVENRISGAQFREALTNKPLAGTFDDSKIALFLTGSCLLSNRLSLGLSLKQVSQKVIDNSPNSYGLDLGVLFNPTDRFRLGACLQNLIHPEFSRSSAKEDAYPINIKIGLAITPFDNWVINLDLDKTSHRSVRGHLGIESRLKDLLSLRTGYDQGDLSCGLGIRLRGLSMDYTITNKEYQPAHQVSLSLSFGCTQEQAWILKQQAKELKKLKQRLNQQKRQTKDDSTTKH